MNMSKVEICGIMIDNLTESGAIERIERLVRNGTSNFVVTPNVDHLIKLQTDMEFRDVYQEADLVLADGMPLIWASKFLGKPLHHRITGSDLFPKLCKRAAEIEYKVFFLGGRPGAAEKAKEILQARFSGLQIVGTYAPPLGFEYDINENKKIIEMLRASSPDILFVGLGAPKQEKWIYMNKDRYEVPVSIGIGVSFEFVAGMVRRAPKWMQRIGIEWFWRFLMEPKKLWKRYFVNDMKIFKMVLNQKREANKKEC